MHKQMFPDKNDRDIDPYRHMCYNKYDTINEQFRRIAQKQPTLTPASTTLCRRHSEYARSLPLTSRKRSCSRSKQSAGWTVCSLAADGTTAWVQMGLCPKPRRITAWMHALAALALTKFVRPPILPQFEFSGLLCDFGQFVHFVKFAHLQLNIEFTKTCVIIHGGGKPPPNIHSDPYRSKRSFYIKYPMIAFRYLLSVFDSFISTSPVITESTVMIPNLNKLFSVPGMTTIYSNCQPYSAKLSLRR